MTRQMRRWQEDLDERIKDREKPPSYWDFPEREKGGLHGHCAYCLRADCKRTAFDEDSKGDRACAVSKCRWGCGARMHNCKLFEHQVKGKDKELCRRYVVPILGT